MQQEWKSIRVEVRFQEEILHREHPNSNAFTAELNQWIDLFRPKCLKRTIVALCIPFFQQVSNLSSTRITICNTHRFFQFSGINAFLYYAPTFFAALGQDYNMTLILSGMVNICQLVAGIPTLLFLDQIGRRKLAIIGGFAMGIPHIIMAGIVGKFSSS